MGEGGDWQPSSRPWMCCVCVGSELHRLLNVRGSQGVRLRRYITISCRRVHDKEPGKNRLKNASEQDSDARGEKIHYRAVIKKLNSSAYRNLSVYHIARGL